MIAVIVPAHNEAAVIGACLDSLAVAAAHPGLDGEAVLVLVALDHCTDATAAICAAHGVACVPLQARCVGTARDTAAQQAVALGARWIASTDADTVVPPDWLWRQLACGADAFCGVVGVHDWRGYSDAVRIAFTRSEQCRDGHRHVHGANMGFSARAYAAAGGFPSLATGEDVALARALEANGERIAWLAQPQVVTSARRSARAPQGFSQFLRALEEQVGPVPMAGRALRA